MTVFTAEEKIRQQQFKYLADNGTRKIVYNTAVDATVTLYTVPTNKKFYLCSAVLDFVTGVGPNKSAKALVAGVEIAFIVLAVIDTDKTVSIDFAVPLIVNDGETIQVHSSSAGTEARLCITGYETDA